MLRTITLSLLLLVSIGVVLPFDESTAHGIRQSSVSNNGHYRRHSRAWWRRYRARLKRRRAAAMAHRKALLGPVIPQPAGLDTKSTKLLVNLPAGWNSLPQATSGEMKFRASAGANVPGQATLSVVALSRPLPIYITSREERRLLAGVAVTDLRRIVIDKMITAGGWVTNDYQRDVSGYRVFVVTAQTPSDARSPEQSWNFYFTEINGRIYSLTTNTPRQFYDRMAAEAEKFIASLHATSPSSADTPPKR